MNRRFFLRTISSLLGVTSIYIANQVITSSSNLKQMNKFSLRLKDISEGINIKNDYIIIKEKKNFQVYLSKCTHLGCKINFYENQEIICKCHGSRFDTKGNVIKGPANLPLQKLNFKIISDKTMIIYNNEI